MEESPTPTITSFVIRFVHQGAADPLTYRGSIVHVQTNQETSFASWEDAVAFIERFVRLESDEEQPPTPLP